MKFKYIVFSLMTLGIILIHLNSYALPHSLILRHIILILFIVLACYYVHDSRRRHRAELEKLKSFLRVCAWCKKVCVTDAETKEDNWIFFEEYIALEHKQTSSHGICLECYKKEGFVD